MMFLLAFASLSAGAFAQETRTTEIPTQKDKVITNGFWDNWFVDFGGDFISNYSNQEHRVSANPFAIRRGNFGFDASLGKWATPSFGIRAKFQAAWGRTVHSDNIEHNPLYNQVNISLQPMINLHNLFAGYKPRVWNTIVYASVGYERNIDDKVNSAIVGCGWLNTFNVTKRFHINVDIYTNMGDAAMDGAEYNSSWDGAIIDTKGNDWQLGWSIGCGFNLGKVGWDNAPDVDAIMAMNNAQIEALNATLAQQQTENTRLHQLMKSHKCPEPRVMAQIVTTSASVFFNINKSKIASKKDLVNVKELAECAKATGKTIVVTGYADSNTGSAEYNQKLSLRRAETVAKELVKMGFSEEKIEVVGKGGVKDLEPISYNRRVVVTLK
ncbi:MAG: OmpA family protein [Bacteroidaceae bacterium]|nr:OmpA family protein [Bacteroidaceae bacterium]